jgi:CelD/BcsL family acetyltransferase involved in cellulose biosynthesis
VEIRTIRGTAALEQSVDAILDCMRRSAGVASFKQDPHWILANADRHREPDGPHVVAIEDHHRIVAYLPIRCLHHTVCVPGDPARIPIYSGLVAKVAGRDVVAPADIAASSLQLLARYIAVRQAEYPLVLVEEAHPKGSLARAFGDHFWVTTLPLMDHVVRTATRVDGRYESAIGNHTRSNLRRLMRRYADHEGAEPRFEIVERADDVDRYCEALAELYPRTWHAHENPHDWRDPVHAAYFRQLAQRQRFFGALMHGTNGPIAFAFGCAFDGTFYLEELGYDARYDRYSLGTSVTFELVRHLLDSHRIDRVDYGFGDGKMKRMLATESYPITAFIAATSARGRLATLLARPLVATGRLAMRMRRAAAPTE